MISDILKLIFIYYFCILFCLNFINIRKKTISNRIYTIASAIILSTLSFTMSCINTNLEHILPIMLLWFFISFILSNPQGAFIAIMVSFTISYTLHAASSAIAIFLLTPFFYKTNSFPYLLLSILTGFIQTLFYIGICKTKRYKKGIPLLLSTPYTNIGTLFSMIFVCVLIFNPSHSFDMALQLPTLILFIFTLPFLIYWWQAQITKAYRRSLELRELESMRTEMAELKIKMQELTDENERLARITHRDNTLISALKNSTIKYLSTDFANPAVALETRNQLIENINALSAGRSSLAEARKEQSARTFETGFSLLNTLLHEMDEKAIGMNIAFAVHMGTSLDDFVPGSVSEDDLVHTIDDLLKNAFKATTTCEKRMVQLQFYKLGKHLVVEVADNGIPFEVKSLVNMGMEKLTTYEDGSGIGLVDIWSTKEKYGATYHLDECVNASPFTKKISLTFDKKNRYSIRTLRKEEILQASRRADLQVYDYNE